MNIFVLDQDPRVCARYHNDKHVVKMILETAQLLCGVHHVTESNLDVPYGLSHKNHPCSIWARKCLENYIWLCELGMELSTEYTHRYGRRHKSQDIIEWCLINLPNLPEFGRITDQPKAMPDECKTDDVVESYRRYYIMEKRGFCNWKNREIPNWYKINLDN